MGRPPDSPPPGQARPPASAAPQPAARPLSRPVSQSPDQPVNDGAAVDLEVFFSNLKLLHIRRSSKKRPRAGAEGGRRVA